MQFLKKHPFAIVYVLIALALAFFGSRLFGDSTKVGDVIFFAVFCAALLVLPAVEVGEKILKALAKLEPKGWPVTGSVDYVDRCRSDRHELELALVHALAPHVACDKDGASFGSYIRFAVDAMLEKVQSIIPPTVLAGGAGDPGAQADQSAEAEIVAAGLTAPRVTAEQIKALMDKLTWRYEQPEGTTSTLAHAYLGSFYLVTGHSACVSPENFNAELGMKYAREQAEGKARDKLWELEGYALFKQQA